MTQQIKISDTNTLTLESKQFKDQWRLNIYKSVFSKRYTWVGKWSALLFDLPQVQKLNDLIQSINDEKDLKEYGQFDKWSKVFKVAVSSFKWTTSVQVRERVESEKYTGRGKQWVSFPVKFLEEFQILLPQAIGEYEEVLWWKVIEKDMKTEVTDADNSSNPEVDSYF